MANELDEVLRDSQYRYQRYNTLAATVLSMSERALFSIIKAVKNKELSKDALTNYKAFVEKNKGYIDAVSIPVDKETHDALIEIKNLRAQNDMLSSDLKNVELDVDKINEYTREILASLNDEVSPGESANNGELTRNKNNKHRFTGKEKKALHSQIAANEERIEYLQKHSVVFSQIDKLREQGADIFVMPMQDDSNILNLMYNKKDEALIKTTYQQLMANMYHGGEYDREHLRVITSNQMSLVNLPLEGDIEKGQFTEILNTLGVRYALVPDPYIGDGHSMFDIANSDIRLFNVGLQKYENMYGKKLTPEWMQDSTKLRPDESYGDADFQAAKEAANKNITISDEDFKEMLSNNDINFENIYEKEPILSAQTPEYVDWVKQANAPDSPIVQISINNNHQNPLEGHVENGMFVAYVPNTQRQSQFKIPSCNVFYDEKREAYLAFFDKRKDIEVVSAKEGSVRYAGKDFAKYWSTVEQNNAKIDEIKSIIANKTLDVAKVPSKVL